MDDPLTTIRVRCSCGARLSVPDAALGKWVACPKCGQRVEVLEDANPTSASLRPGVLARVMVGFIGLGLLAFGVLLVVMAIWHWSYWGEAGGLHTRSQGYGGTFVLFIFIGFWCVWWAIKGGGHDNDG